MLRVDDEVDVQQLRCLVVWRLASDRIEKVGCMTQVGPRLYRIESGTDAVVRAHH